MTGAAGPPDWTAPGAHPVHEDVFRIPLPLPTDGLRAVNVYAIRTPSGIVMIDAGWALEEARRRLEWSLKEMDARPADITRFLVTHAHRDHYTQAVTVRAEFGTRVSLGIGERVALTGMAAPDARHGAPQLARLRRGGADDLARELVDTHRFGGSVDLTNWDLPDDWIEAGELPLDGRSLLAVPTPGHTRGHLVFADRAAGLMFAGDHVLPHITPSIGFEHSPPALPLAAYLDSLTLVRRMPDLRLLPAHGPVTTSVHARVDELLAHHAHRLDECVAAVAGGADTANGVAHVLRWTRRGRELGELDPFNRMLAVVETLAHLDLLAAHGRLTVSEDTAGASRFALPAG